MPCARHQAATLLVSLLPLAWGLKGERHLMDKNPPCIRSLPQIYFSPPKNEMAYMNECGKLGMKKSNDRDCNPERTLHGTRTLSHLLWGKDGIYDFLKINYLFLAALGLRCCARAFSSCGERGLLLVAVHGLLIVVASLVAEHGL